jgi:uncharacterized protein (TIGR03435 family)
MIRSAVALSVFASLALAAGTRPAFEVASIHPSEGGPEAAEVRPGSVNLRNMSLTGVIGWAYNVLDAQVSGPAWLNTARFHIAAKAGSPAHEADMRTMMQVLLADRFKLELHSEMKETNAMILTVAKGGHKLKEAGQEGSPSFSIGGLNLTGKGATIAQLISFLSSQIRLPIVDRTGLTGRYDYFLDINAYVTDEMRNQQNGPPIDAPSIIASALQAQLGLKTEVKKTPVEALVIDKIEKTPTEN